MTIYTRGGDGGQTSLANGVRLAKSDPRVDAYGELDEATSVLGLAIAAQNDARLRASLLFLQQRLYTLAALVAGAQGEHLRIAATDNTFLEAEIDRLQAACPPLTHFILPGGGEAAARLHLARCVVRRAERRVVALGDATELLPPAGLAFLNRASDLLFVAARFAAGQETAPEIPFDPSCLPPEA